ncbi:MAG: hypothetical protein JWQ49_5585 [Edaphobacter sp.]|nr:hypothetical protein [Edaphobacter sp.]
MGRRARDSRFELRLMRTLRFSVPLQDPTDFRNVYTISREKCGDGSPTLFHDFVPDRLREKHDGD